MRIRFVVKVILFQIICRLDQHNLFRIIKKYMTACGGHSLFDYLFPFSAPLRLKPWAVYLSTDFSTAPDNCALNPPTKIIHRAARHGRLFIAESFGKKWERLLVVPCFSP